MKLMDARKVGTDLPVLISWSPKADIFAVAYNNAHVSLYRINWQKVSDCGCLKEGIPDHIAWHPEGQYVCFVIKKVVYILEVDHGRLISKYNMHDEVLWLKWRSTIYEVLHTDKKTEGDAKPRANKQQIEQHLSLLIYGCRNGHIYVYCGGHVLLHHIKPSLGVPRLKLLSGDISDDLQNLAFIGQRVIKAEDSDGTEFVFKHCRNFIMPSLVHTISHLTFRFGSLKAAWKQVVGQLNTLSDYWSKMYDVYNFYINHCPTQPLSEALAQYYELALNRVDSVEIQMFLSAAGMDKEVKKKIPVITSNAKNLNELIPTIKVSLTRCACDAQMICRFMRQFSGVSGDKAKFRLLRKTEIVFRGLLSFVNDFHARAQIFADDMIQFMLLITYTIHSFNSTDYITEIFDLRKVLRLLDSKVARNVFEYYLINHKMEQTTEKRSNHKTQRIKLKKMLAATGRDKSQKKTVRSSVPKQAKHDISSPAAGCSPKKNSPRVSSGSDSRRNSPSKTPKTDWDVLRNAFKTLVGQTSPNYGVTVDKLIEDVFKIPLVDPPCVYGPYRLFETEDTSVTPLASDMWIDSESLKTRIFVHLNTKKMYLFEFDCSENVTKLKSSSLVFSRELTTTVFYSNDFLTTVSYDAHDKEEEDEHGRTLVCQLSIESALSKGKYAEQGYFVVNDEEEYFSVPPPDPIEVHVPVEKTVVNPSSVIRHILPLENACPHRIAVSGFRKAGVFLNKECDRILVLDLDPAIVCDEQDSEIAD